MVATLEPTRTRAGAYEEGDFVVDDDVPVFRDHEREGVKFDKYALQRIANRCNRRIDDTGDYCPIVIRHNGGDDHGQGDDNHGVVGFAGPFSVKRLTLGNGQSGWFIVARHRYYKEDYGKVKKFPRRSVEYWANEKDPTGGYFDPICLLGSETPHLDLGIRYSKSGHEGERRICYQATAPSGSNTAMPEFGDDEERTSYERGDAMSFSQEQLAQLVEAFRPVMESIVDEKLAPLQKAMAEIAPTTAGMDEAAGLSDGDLDTAGTTADDETMLAEGGAAAATDVPIDSDDDNAGDDVDVDDEPSTEDGEGDVADATDEEEDDMSDSDKETVAKYQKEAKDYRLKYEKAVADNKTLKAENEKLKAQVGEVEVEKRKVSRYQKLAALEKEGFNFDAEEEVKDVIELSDEQFDRHLDRIRTRYQRVPINGSTYIPPKVIVPEQSMEKRMLYSKTARDRVLAAQQNGTTLDFVTELKKVYAETNEKYPGE